MEKQTFSTSMSPEVIIEVIDGELNVKGWDEPEVVVDADPESLTLEHQEDSIRLTCQSNCALRLPSDATLKVESVHGEALFKSLSGQIEIEEAHGNLVLRSVGATRVETVHGELVAKEIAGDLVVDKVMGNAVVRDVQGICTLTETYGNLDLRDVDGDVKADAHGNARIRLNSMGGENYEIKAGGNVHCHIPEDANLKLVLTSDAEIIRLKMPGGTQSLRQAQYELSVGEGQGRMTVEAGGSLYLFARSAEWAEREAEFEAGFSGLPDDFSERIAQQVQAQIQQQMETMTKQLDRQMERMSEQFGKSGMSAEEMERILEQARRTGEREAERAQEKMRRAQEKLERKLEAARRRQELKMQISDRREGRRRSWGVDLPTPPTPPIPPAPPVKEPVSEEERLMILRMLEQKKINLEEASQLLSALEGKEVEA